MEKCHRVEGLLIKKAENEGAKGKMAFLPLLPLTGKQRSGAGSPAVALVGGLGLGGGREEGERGREVRGFDPPLDFGKEGPRGGVRRPWPSRRAAAMGSVSRGGQGRVLGRKREREGPGTYLGPWLEQGRGGAGRPREVGTAAEQACGGGGGRGAEGAAQGPLYRPSNAVG